MSAEKTALHDASASRRYGRRKKLARQHIPLYKKMMKIEIFIPFCNGILVSITTRLQGPNQYDRVQASSCFCTFH